MNLKNKILSAKEIPFLIKNKDFYTDKMNYFQIDDRLMNIDIDTSDDYLMAKKIFSSK